MGRIARVVIPGMPHHVTQRGNDRQTVFFSDDDRCYYLSLYRHYTRRYGIRTWAYCLMDNHVHWVVVPDNEDSLGQCFHALDTKYAGRMNAQKRRTGHFYQGRFYSSVLDNDYLWAAVRYVERNPVRAKIVERAEAYEWSSAAGHCGMRVDVNVSSDFPTDGVIPDWREWLSTEDQTQTNNLRRQTSTGRPCGALSVVDQLEARLGRVLRPQKRGPKAVNVVAGQGDLFS